MDAVQIFQPHFQWGDAVLLFERPGFAQRVADALLIIVDGGQHGVDGGGGVAFGA